MKRKKIRIIIIIIVVIAILMLLTAFAIINIQKKDETKSQKEETEKNILDNIEKELIDTPDEVLIKLNALYKKKGYIFIYKETNGNTIIYEQINDTTKEVNSTYSFDIDNQVFTISSYSTSSGTVPGK